MGGVFRWQSLTARSVLTIEIAMLRTGKEAGQTRVTLRFSLQEFLRRYFTRADSLI